MDAIFRGSLTELEAARLLAVSAQLLGTGKSLELAQKELGKSTTAGAKSSRSTISPTPTRQGNL